jgi:hypothetical protein
MGWGGYGGWGRDNGAGVGDGILAPNPLHCHPYTLGRAENLVFMPMHIQNYMAKKSKLKKSQKNKVFEFFNHNASRHCDFFKPTL